MANTIGLELKLEGAQAIRALKGIQKGLKETGKQGTKSIGAMDIALGGFVANIGSQIIFRALGAITQGLKEAGAATLEFGKAIQEINSIVPRTALETLALKQQLIGLSNEFGDKAQNQAKAFYNVLSAGITDTTTALNFLETANKAAVAGLVDVDTAARGLLSVTKSYTDGSITAAQASDILFTAVREGRTTFGELADTVGRVASISASAKVAFSEVAGALAFVTKSGIRTDEAVIGLRGLLTSIIGPTDDVRKLAKELGVEFNSTALRTKGLIGFFNDLAIKTKGNVETIRALFPNVRAFNVAIKIAGGDLADFNRILGETENSAGATQKAFQIITDSAAFQFEKLTNQLKNFPTAILTNFEEPMSDALKTLNEFVGNQGLLLVVDGIDLVIRAFEFFIKTGSLVDQTFNFLAGGALEVIKSFNEFILATNQAWQAARRFAGLDPSPALKKEEAAAKKRIEIINGAITANQKETVAIQNEEEKRLASTKAFREKLAAGRQAFEASEDARKKQREDEDKAKAEKAIEELLENESSKFNAIEELKIAQNEQTKERETEEKLAKQLEDEEAFIFLQDNLGREAAAKELNRISEIEGEAKRKAELKKLNDKARKEEMGGIFAIRKFEDLSNKEKISAQKSTLATISTLSSSNNTALFLIGKAASLALAGINVSEGVTKALSAFPPPFNFAAAAAVGAAGAIQIAKIATTSKPSAGSFQGGGIIDVPGGSQTGDQLSANVNNREAIFNLRQQKNLFDAVNKNQLGGGGGLTVNIEAGVGGITDDQVDTLIDAINDRTEFGNKELKAA